MKEENKNKLDTLTLPFWFLLLVNTIIFILLSCLMPIRYEENDDVIMLLIASGVYSGVPDAHLVFINYVYGLLLKLFYSNFPTIEWYSYFFSVIHIISMSIISWCIINYRTSSIYKLLFLLLFYSLEAWIILNFQFTTTAAVVGTAALVLFLEKETFSYKILGILLFLLASLIRFEVAFLILCVFVPILLMNFLASQRKIPYIIFGLFLVLLPLVFKTIDTEIYNKDVDWREYKEFNTYRGRINDNPNAFVFEKLPSQINSADYNLFLFFFPDLEVFDNETTSELLSQIDVLSLSQKIKNMMFAVKTYAKFLLCLSLVVLFQLYCLKDNRKRVVLLLSFLVFFSLMCYISINGIFKFRVFVAAIFPFCWILFTMRNPSSNKYVWVPIGVLFLVFTGHLVERSRNLNVGRTERVEETVSLLSKVCLEENEYITPFYSALKYEDISPFMISQECRKPKFYALGWLSKIPFQEGKLGSYRDLINQNAIFIERIFLDFFVTNMKESVQKNYNMDIDYQVLDETENLMVIKLIESQEVNSIGN